MHIDMFLYIHLQVGQCLYSCGGHIIPSRNCPQARNLLVHILAMFLEDPFRQDRTSANQIETFEGC